MHDWHDTPAVRHMRSRALVARAARLAALIIGMCVVGAYLALLGWMSERDARLDTIARTADTQAKIAAHRADLRDCPAPRAPTCF